MNYKNFRDFCVSIGNLPSSYADSMSYYELLMWLCNYIENAYDINVKKLEDYFENYIEELNIDTIVSAKLDEMAQNGTLTNMISGYIDPIINEFENYVNGALNVQNTSITNIDNKVNSLENQITSLASGSPSGVYATVEALTSADPDHSKIYVVTADGDWYYYNNSTSSWTSGGSYQTSSITENSISTYQTQFYSTINLLPYNNWVEGKVLNVTSGEVQTWATGCYNNSFINVNNAKKYLMLNNDDLPYQTPTFYEYDNSGTYLGTYVRPDTNTKLIEFGSSTIKVKVAFWNVSFSTLGVYCIFNTLDNILRLNSYSKYANIDEKYYNQMTTDDVILKNKYGFRLIPYPSLTSGNVPSSIKYNSIYEVEQKTIMGNSANYQGIAFKVDVASLSAGDKLYVDVEGSTSGFNSLSFYPGSTGSGSTNFSLVSGTLYAVTLTANDITTMTTWINNGNFPRIIMSYTVQAQGVEIVRHMRCYINDDFSSLNNILIQLQKQKTPNKYKALFLGDSITALGGNRSWVNYFSDIIPLEDITNYAVNGAHLKDYENTVYDGNPSSAVQDNNVLGNQIQKVINNSISNPDFEIIMIAIGTNGGVVTTKEQAIGTYVDSNDSPIPIADVDRKTDAGAFRYANEKLLDLYPNAVIIWCTPIQAAYSVRDLSDVITWGDNIKMLCNVGSVNYIDTEKCGIIGYNETADQNGLDLQDGLHPNSHGAKKIGTYNAVQFKKYLDKLDLYK